MQIPLWKEWALLHELSFVSAMDCGMPPTEAGEGELLKRLLWQQACSEEEQRGGRAACGPRAPPTRKIPQAHVILTTCQRPPLQTELMCGCCQWSLRMNDFWLYEAGMVEGGHCGTCSRNLARKWDPPHTTTICLWKNVPLARNSNLSTTHQSHPHHSSDTLDDAAIVWITSAES